jgi:hypothetical protein
MWWVRLDKDAPLDHAGSGKTPFPPGFGDYSAGRYRAASCGAMCVSLPTAG